MEPISKAFPISNSSWPFTLQRDPRKVIAGIRLLWVAAKWRRKGIAKCLMDVVRSKFVYGCVLSKREMAISPPPETAFSFFKNYFSPNQDSNQDDQPCSYISVYGV